MQETLQLPLWLVSHLKPRYPWSSKCGSFSDNFVRWHDSFCLQVLRDGNWSEQEASILVPGDLISVKLGDIIPADARLLEGDPLKIDQSALTGESLPVTKHPGDEVFSGSTCKQGEIEAVVIATGVHTFFGKAAHLVDSTNNVGHFQKVSYVSWIKMGDQIFNKFHDLMPLEMVFIFKSGFDCHW